MALGGQLPSSLTSRSPRRELERAAHSQSCHVDGRVVAQQSIYRILYIYIYICVYMYLRIHLFIDSLIYLSSTWYMVYSTWNIKHKDPVNHVTMVSGSSLSRAVEPDCRILVLCNSSQPFTCIVALY